MLTPTPKHEHEVRLKLRQGKTLRKIRHIKTQPKEIKMKTVYRIKATDQKNHLNFFKIRTKASTRTIKRMASLHGLNLDRIST